MILMFSVGQTTDSSAMFHPSLPLFRIPLMPDHQVMRDAILADPFYRLNPLPSIGHGPLTGDLAKFLLGLQPPSPMTDLTFAARGHHLVFDPLGFPSLQQLSFPPHYFDTGARGCPAGSTFNMAELFSVSNVRCPLCVVARPADFAQSDQHHVDESTWKTMDLAVPSTAKDALSLKPPQYGLSSLNNVLHPFPLFPPALLPPWKSVDSVDPTVGIELLHRVTTASSTIGLKHHLLAPNSLYHVPQAPAMSIGKRRCIRCRCPNCMNPTAAADRPKGSKRKHICHFPGCRKVYGKTSHLRAHLRWHVGDRPFRCRWLFCRKSFTRSDELQRHLKTHTGDKKFLCRLCCKRFMRSDHLKKHLKTHQVRDTLMAAASSSVAARPTSAAAAAAAERKIRRML